MTTEPLAPVDVLVLGGGAAGLSAALCLGRSRRSVRVLDAGEPRNAVADRAHNLLTHDDTPPTEILAAGRAEVERYGVQVVPTRVVEARRLPGDEPAFEVRTGDGAAHRARRLVLASGLRDELPDVPGLRERWGRDVLHCPYCHGWEVRDRRLAVLASGSSAVHRALLVRQLSDDVTVVLDDSFDPDADERADLAARGVRVAAGRVTGVRVEGDALTGLLLADGTAVPCDAVFVAPRAVLADAVVDGLGLATDPVGSPDEDLGRAVRVDGAGATSVPGVWAAGNVTGPQHALASSIAAGSAVGAQVNLALVTADLAAARA
ncbi:NAD(P)/FAD-dependent oxidoreductase [Cellulomonas xiejunii]|uniref:NAD(P)/FAD-dependent oxidoreductase n=1 Tax=Cellulomonas xiejunii TaxID=2968083 RepID=A0ABY5KPT4_9CELL|nr:NAD(P)/FAD-dependent oxidoreductase [Cellulomonas xiejunii]MCC2320901.1 NAD(P)/FAD-dependent oxidoreductase [Cellulomonas xiejunii]UUI71182.1 NAD(P)/FAD-dependent oxidoreductase [Cellulomonas xiejunii]